jgi:hypothetical protein
MQDIWSGVVDKIQAVKRSSVTPKPKEDEDLSSIVEALRSKARRHGELWGDHDGHINQLAREMHGVKTDFSWLHDHVMHVYGDRFKADEKDVKDLRETVERQNDTINDLKEQVAVLAGKICWCGESAGLTDRDAEGDRDLEYESDKVGFSVGVRVH